MHFNNLYSHTIQEDNIDNSIVRWKFVNGLIVCGFITIILKLLDLSCISLEEIKSAHTKDIQKKHVVSRANITDRNGILIASNIRTASVYSHPKQMIDKPAAIKALMRLNIGLNEKELIQKFSTNKDFVWIKRHITPNTQQLIHNLGIPGLYFAQDEKRIYPHENLFAHALGYVGLDGHGMAGIERVLDSELIELSQKSEPLQLSLDVRIQNILHTEIQNSITMHSAVGGSGIVMDVNTGEIIAMVSLPDFNPNNLNTAKKEHMFNQMTLGNYEMGSTLKPLTVAMALDSNKITVNEAFDVSKPIKVGRFQINDYKAKGGYLSVPEILMYSSNLGVAQIARLVGIKNQREYLGKFGVLSELRGTIPEKVKPIFPNEKNWTDASMVTISYGHGVAMSGMHLIRAIASIVNGGLLYEPTLLKQDQPQNISYKRVLKEQTSHTMRKLLRLVAESGSARKANIDGLLVGGKTGTAEKNKNGHYAKNLNMAIFVGAFPINKPEYAILIMIDEAKPNAINHGYTTGGMIAAPVAGNVIKRMAQILGIMHQDRNDKAVMQAMYLDYIPRYQQTTVATR